MADEITDCNVIRTWRVGDRWYARIGPEHRGLTAYARTASGACIALAIQAAGCNWPWDDTWRPR